MGRRWGKSVLAGAVSLACANAGARVAWIVPTYKNGRPLWRWAEAVTLPLKPAGVQTNRSERVITFPSGGMLGIYSADNPTSILGEAFHLAILDEAARIAEEVWTETVMPTLADYGGRAILISTPRGRNWFYEEWMRGQGRNDQVKSWNAPTSDNPNPRIQRAAQLARDRVVADVYRQEWLAQFVEDGLTLFQLVDIDAAERSAPGPLAVGRPGGWYVTSVDIGRRRDATVINTFDAMQEPFQRVAFDRLERVPYPVIQARIEERVRAFPGPAYVESNGVGDPVIENLEVSVEPFVTTARSKVQALQALQLLFEKQRLKARWDARERQALKSAAWADAHTADEIMSLAIGAYHLVNAGTPGL